MKIKILFLLMCLLPGQAIAPDQSEIFRNTARAYWAAAGKCWAAPMWKNYDLENVIEGSLDAVEWWWSDASKRKKVWVLFQLSLTEGENLKDPSYGPFGVTLDAAKAVRRRVKGSDRTPLFCFPLKDKYLARKLSQNHKFNAYVAAGILKHCWDYLPKNYETKAVLSYKMGRRGNFNGRAAMIRKRHYWIVRRQMRCLSERVRSGTKAYCECMK